MGIFTRRAERSRSGALGSAAEAALGSARAAALRIYARLADPKLTARALLESVSPDLARARKVLLSQIHPGTHSGLSDEDNKLLGLAANVVVTAYDLAKKQKTKLVTTDLPEQTAFADACKFAREAAPWAQSFAKEAHEVQQAGVSDTYAPSIVREHGVRRAPTTSTVVAATEHPARQAMTAGLRAALEAYAEMMALADPDRPTVDIKA